MFVPTFISSSLPAFYYKEIRPLPLPFHPQIPQLGNQVPHICTASGDIVLGTFWPCLAGVPIPLASSNKILTLSPHQHSLISEF